LATSYATIKSSCSLLIDLLGMWIISEIGYNSHKERIGPGIQG
jgi:hypothetical protein